MIEPQNLYSPSYTYEELVLLFGLLSSQEPLLHSLEPRYSHPSSFELWALLLFCPLFFQELLLIANEYCYLYVLKVLLVPQYLSFHRLHIMLLHSVFLIHQVSCHPRQYGRESLEPFWKPFL